MLVCLFMLCDHVVQHAVLTIVRASLLLFSSLCTFSFSKLYWVLYGHFCRLYALSWLPVDFSSLLGF